MAFKNMCHVPVPCLVPGTCTVVLHVLDCYISRMRTSICDLHANLASYGYSSSMCHLTAANQPLPMIHVL